ncbi:FxSxx-COOH system tetratricopeptide repeat protein [Actinoplanes siamensis]|uniref:NTPase n=1 Tax=Actinoplanes siamensis TaxID=1223317 RepID=A0A919TKD2_9ACTN|nr:FxSxx-COOH system tetratricopeptide repeat protein [Actinoplanes siamensis]GIF05467.1 NTPase [Actinoplanes siamensis]
MTAATQDGLGSAGRTEIVAFASPGQRGSGQTSVVGNAAWALAAAGRRVLVLDWATSPPPVGAYLGMPVAEPEPGPDLTAAGRLLGLSWRRLRRYQTPRHAGPGLIDVVPEATPPNLDPVPDWAAAREQLRACGYDYLLVDSPQGLGAAYDVLAELSDTVVVCFRPGTASVHRLLTMVDGLLGGERRPRLVTVLTQFSPAPAETDSLRHLEDRLARLRDGGEAGVDVVEIPQHAYHERLAVTLDDGAVRDGLLRVVRLITGGAVQEPPAVDPAVRSWYRHDFADLSGIDPVGTVHLAYQPSERRWADWVWTELDRCGAKPQDADPDQTVVIGPPPAGAASPVLQIQVDDPESGPADGGGYVIGLSGRSEDDARGLLLTHLGMRPRTEPPGPEVFRPRYPGGDPTAPELIQVPARDDGFVGRVDEIEALRDRLLGTPGEPIAIVGEPGAGKTQLALEYVRQFLGDYDVVWWVPAEDRETIDRSLTRLGAGLDELRGPAPGPAAEPAPDEHDLGPDARQALTRLADRTSPRPYLLVFDNVRDVGHLGTLPRAGHGHVLIVAQPGVLPAGSFPELPLGPLRERDSIALLQRSVPDMAVEDAAAIAAATGHLPLALRLAGAWLEDQVNELFRKAPAAALTTVRAAAAVLRERVGPDAPGSGLLRIWQMVRENLHRTPTGRLAVRLAELCAYLSGDRIGLRLIRSSPMVEALLEAGGEDAARLESDPVEFDRILWTGARFGVFELVWGSQGRLRMNSALQRAVRDSLSPEARAERRARAQRVLARFAPGIVEDDDREQQSRLIELQAHLGPSGATEAVDVAVRRWVVRQVRHMQLQQVAGVNDAALEVAQRALASWQHGAVPPDDPALLWLRVELANILRRRGEYGPAREIDEDVRRLLLGGPGDEHPRSLIVARGLAGDLRALGRFEDAAHFDRIAFDGFRNLFGGDHAHTLMAAHNFALSSYLNGDVHTAVQRERDVLERRIRLLTETNPRTWWTAGSLGVYQRESGDLEGALQTLRQAKLWAGRSLGPGRRENPVDLRVERAFLTTVWRAGKMTARTAISELEQLVAAYGRVSGERHPDTWGCRLAVASVLHGAGRSREAAATAQAVLAGYEDSHAFGADHPITAVCRLNLAVYLRGAGDLEEARDLGEKAWQGLEATLSGETHPWVLAAMIDQSGHLAAAGRREEASELAARALKLCREDLPRHPYTIVARSNVEGRIVDIDIDVPSM